MKTVPLTAYPRASVRGAAGKRLRASGRVPAVIYGRKLKPQNVEVKRKELEDVTHHAASENLLLDLSIDGDGGKRLVLVKEIQHHPINGQPLHVDLHEVAEDEKVTMMVPVESVGEAAGVKVGGGVLEHVLFKIKVRALPKDLPEVITVDVSHLEIGQTLHLGDIKPPAGVELIGDNGISVISVAEPITEAEEQAALETAAAPGEVEMIKEKKEEGAPAEAGKAGAEKAPAAKAGEKAPAAKAAEKAPEKGAEKKPEKK